MVPTVVLVALSFAMTLMAAEAPRMTKEELKGKLENPEVIIIDVRTGTDWKASEFKIKGALREEPAAAGEWMKKYPKDKSFVFYCA
jgi:rhodanese-related sulfurtransferase